MRKFTQRFFAGVGLLIGVALLIASGLETKYLLQLAAGAFIYVSVLAIITSW